MGFRDTGGTLKREMQYLHTASTHPPRILSVRLQTHPGNVFMCPPHIAGVLVVADDVAVYGGQVELSSSRSVGVWGQ